MRLQETEKTLYKLCLNHITEKLDNIKKVGE